MRSRFPILAVLIAATFLVSTGTSSAKEPSKGKKGLSEGSYYEFRGHIYDRSTIAHTFTLYWSEGSQPISVTSETKIYRKDLPASLEAVKSGDSVCGIGQARKGQILAVAVAFGDEGVTLPEKARMPKVSLLPLAPISHGGR